MALQTLSRHHHAFPEQHSTYYPAAYAPPPQQQQHLASSYQIHTREPLYRDPLYHQTFSPNQGVYYQAPASSHFTPTTTAHSYQPPAYPSTALPMQTPLAHQPLTSYSPPLPTSLSTIDTTPRPRTDLSPVESLQGSRYHKNKRSQDKHGRSGSKTATTPGPIKATGPLVVWEDHNGVRYITFQYSINRETQNIRIRCDIDSVDLDSLSYDFKLEMSVYPRAFEEKDYNSKRAPYERECNQIAWALVKLNDCLAGNRGLRQRAVDSWRNSSHDEKKRSRRVRRTIKETYRREKQASLEESLESSPLLDFEPHPSSYPSSGHSAGMMMMPTHMHTPPLSTSDPLEYARYPI